MEDVPKVRDPVARWVPILALGVQLLLGAIAYGRIEGRLAAVETEVHMIMQQNFR